MRLWGRESIWKLFEFYFSMLISRVMQEEQHVKNDGRDNMLSSHVTPDQVRGEVGANKHIIKPGFADSSKVSSA